MKNKENKNLKISPINNNLKIDKQQEKLVDQIIEEEALDTIDEERIKELKHFKNTYIWAIIVMILLFLVCLSLTGYFVYQNVFAAK